MIRLEMKNFNTILMEKLTTYQPYHQAKLMSINILIDKYEYLGKEVLPSNQQEIEQAKFTYSPLGKPFEKQFKIMEKNKLRF